MKFLLLGLVFANSYLTIEQMKHLPKYKPKKTYFFTPSLHSNALLKHYQFSCLTLPYQWYLRNKLMPNKPHVVHLTLEEQITHAVLLVKELLAPENPKTTKQICQEILKFNELLETYPKLRPVIEHQYQEPNILTFLEEYRNIDFKTQLPHALAKESYQIMEDFNKKSFWEKGRICLQLQAKFK